MASLGLGLAALGRPGYINVGHGRDLAPTRLDPDAMQQRVDEVLDAAVAAGIDYVDAARSYGRAEEFLASWLASRARPVGSPVVGSKWGYTYTAGWRVQAEQHEVKDHGLATFRRQIAESRALLGDHLARYQVHSATLESGVLDDRAVLDALAELAASGTAVGITTSGPAQAATIRRALRIDSPFTSVQATWNLYERSAGPALAEAHAAGWRVIVKEALANGRLAATDGVALATALAQPWADVVLSGAATVAHLQSNMAALDLVDGIDPDASAGMVESPERYWATRAALPWN
ncbi:MAG: mxcA [Acidimicrobiales bacterium]|jgi:aryl-alcohol dehydrogenase-like predicted oxidoreductase|nr:mxcA [Acidimicrobiales bacterium]